MTRLETQRLALRGPLASDCDALVGFFTSERASFLGGPMALGKAWRHVATICGHWTLKGFGPFILTDRDSGESLGLTGPWAPGDRPEPEVVWALWDRAPKGKGLAQEGAQAALDHLFGDLNWPSVVSYIDRGNAASIALAMRLGGIEDPAAPRPQPTDLVFRHAAPKVPA
ncbi:MAG: GNAT family N-acetyltransferase [Pseudomonadota bacterium]